VAVLLLFALTFPNSIDREIFLSSLCFSLSSKRNETMKKRDVEMPQILSSLVACLLLLLAAKASRQAAVGENRLYTFLVSYSQSPRREQEVSQV